MPQRHCGDLGVEQRVWHLACQVVDDLQILPTRVEDLQDILIGHEKVQQGLEVDAVRLRVDRRRFLTAGNLNQAEVGPVGIFAHELRVHGDEGLCREAVDESFEVVGLRNQRMDTHES